jgi:predicted permease
VGRLRSGVTAEHVGAQIAAEFGRAYAGASHAPVVVSLLDRVVGPAQPWLVLVLVAVALVLLVACVNVASLLLARAAVRVRELATREALGASRRRLAGTLVVEGLLLSLSAAAAAVALSYWGVDLVKARLPGHLARVPTIAVDARVLAVSIAAAVLSGLAFASAPAWLASRSDLVTLMKSGGGAVVGERRRRRSLGAFLVAEVSFISVLLVATTLVVTSFLIVTTADLGFDRRNLMWVQFSQSLKEVPELERLAVATVFRADLLDRVQATPGVASAALITSGLPLSRSTTRYSIEVPGLGEVRGDDMPLTHEVTPGYFSTVALTLTRGRLFTDDDRFGAPRVAIIDEAAARRFFGGRDPIGQVITFRGPTTIVGVVRDVRTFGPEIDQPIALYLPLAQQPIAFAQQGGMVVVRTAGPATAAGTTAAVREVVRSLGNSGAQPPEASLADDRFRELTADRRFNAGLMSIFGVIAIAIGAVGVYGTMAFFVAAEVRAIGLRMALGASPGRVMRGVLRDAGWRVAAGIVIGLGVAWAVSGAFASLVFGVTTTSPAVYAGVAAAIGVVGGLAALVPALRAARLDPLVALRTE